VLHRLDAGARRDDRGHLRETIKIHTGSSIRGATVTRLAYTFGILSSKVPKMPDGNALVSEVRYAAAGARGLAARNCARMPIVGKLK
jgi:hypothetical protein